MQNALSNLHINHKFQLDNQSNLTFYLREKGNIDPCTNGRQNVTERFLGCLCSVFSSWDEWVPEERVLKFSEANLQKQKELIQQHR